MKPAYGIPALVSLLLIGVGCGGEEEAEIIVGEEVLTEDIAEEPHFFSFATGAFVSTHDLTFSVEGMSYVVSLNSAAGVQAISDTSAEFDSAPFPQTALQYDTLGFRVIGDGWMDVGTYHPSDHSIQGNGTVYFIWTASYERVKLEILSASPTQFSFRYAIRESSDSFYDTVVDTVSYTSESPTHFDISAGEGVDATSWDMGLIAVPVFVPQLGSSFPTPTVHLNYERDVKVAVLEDASFEDITSVPSDAAWLEDSGSVRNLGYLGDYEILVYHPELNHQVLVEHPDRVYVVETGGQYYKFQFLEYTGGVVLFHYDRI